LGNQKGRGSRAIRTGARHKKNEPLPDRGKLLMVGGVRGLGGKPTTMKSNG